MPKPSMTKRYADGASTLTARAPSLSRGGRGRSQAARAAPPVDEAQERALLEALLQAVHREAERRLLTRGEIGRGGMGFVTEEYDAVLQRPTAKKTLLDRVRLQPLIVRAFIREAQITGQLDHPNIVPVHDLGLDRQGRLYFTMKRVVGRSLDEVLEDEADNCFIDFATDSLCQRMEILVKVCDALAFAHDRGVLHCDIKAQNIMVGDYGQVYLMDWGLARLLPARPGAAPGVRPVEDLLPPLPEERTRGVVQGTPSYMSPEQARGEALDERSDVFSLGVLMYQILTGRLPYSGGGTLQTLKNAQRGDFPRLAPEAGAQALVEATAAAGPRPPLRLSLIPGELARIVDRATARRPQDRYPSVAALGADLVSFLRGGASFPVRRVSRGELIIKEGEAGDAAYIIINGRCEAFTQQEGQRVSLQLLGPGDVFGELALLLDAPRQASVVALCDAALVTMNRAVIEQELQSMKPWMGACIRAFAARFRDLQQHTREAEARARAPQVQPPPPRRPWRFKLW